MTRPVSQTAARRVVACANAAGGDGGSPDARLWRAAVAEGLRLEPDGDARAPWCRGHPVVRCGPDGVLRVDGHGDAHRRRPALQDRSTADLPIRQRRRPRAAEVLGATGAEPPVAWRLVSGTPASRRGATWWPRVCGVRAPVLRWHASPPPPPPPEGSQRRRTSRSTGHPA